MFHELHVPPRRSPDAPRVVVGEATPVKAVSRNAVPLLAGDLAGFAADTQRRVGEKCCDTHLLSTLLLSKLVLVPPALVMPKNNCPQRSFAGRTSAGNNVAHQRFRLHDAHIRFFAYCEKVVDYVTLDQAAIAPVIRQPDVVHAPPIHPKRP